MATLTITFPCGVRGFHHYNSIWQPVLHETFQARPENGNTHDRYAIATVKIVGGREQIIGHLPREISRFSWFIMSYGATITVQVVDINRRRSPLVQGGLEIPVKVTISMQASDANSCSYTNL